MDDSFAETAMSDGRKTDFPDYEAAGPRGLLQKRVYCIVITATIDLVPGRRIGYECSVGLSMVGD